ncbi:hypothetical protein P4637_20865 [Halalkalibacterium halodurans]|uniref:BH2198 protein n=2 Tax=Halalkalibacterium halodurans TaxID=86665 RepID=Q9KAT8_HALH5|nr:hypothetical protein [Halalkalibacterium halodurans]MDY7222753.1 hypothetical protein [Halalkalibacterium halodurans]MDY7241974.1 hypothetical protein [Halalkalibacterium halodurans]MED4082764.1 hypothetical protein [Halalkalibacterium halodurans]MED4087266.1 hypothetical protein [Halalkalibacterium halodurans]MED4105717.1 hypothetical protein [Halalkalibacterium halodurans]
MNLSIQQKNTICVIILLILMLLPVWAAMVSPLDFQGALKLFPLDFSLFFAFLMGGIIVNYTLRSSKFMIVIMIVAAIGLAVIAYGFIV